MPYSSFTWYWLPVPNLACHSPGRSRSRYGFWSRATSWSTGRTVQSTLGRCYAPDSSAATSLQDTPWRVTYSPYIQPHMVLLVFIVIITIIVMIISIFIIIIILLTVIIAVTTTIVTIITTMIMITIMMIIIITVIVMICYDDYYHCYWADVQTHHRVPTARDTLEIQVSNSSHLGISLTFPNDSLFWPVLLVYYSTFSRFAVNLPTCECSFAAICYLYAHVLVWSWCPGAPVTDQSKEHCPARTNQLDHHQDHVGIVQVEGKDW